LLRFYICAYVCICMCMYMCVHVCVYRCMCICMYMYICTSVYVCIYIYIRARVGLHMHSCRCILFICTILSLYYVRPISLLHARVLQVFLNTCMRVWGGIGNGVCFSMFMAIACYWRGRLCFGRSRDKEIVLYISLFLRVLGWWVCACTRAYTHINYLGT